MITQNLLSLTIWIPILGGILVLATGSDRNATLARWFALAVAVATFLISIGLYTGYASGAQPWISAFNVYYYLGVDGISILLIMLTSFSTVLVVISAWKVIQRRVALYMAAFLIMEGLMIGVFSSLDAILFYVFWEAQLIPMYLIIGIWGGPNRVYAAIKFFLYTFLGSVLMLVAFIYLYYRAGHSFDILAFQHVKLTLKEQILIFFAFLAAFAVKIPDHPGCQP
jgi:NADH-quinone oxidoreductase subunit M